MVDRHTAGKVIQQDYDDLLATGEGSSLFCLSDRTVKMLLATVDFLGWKTRYFSLSDTEIDQDVIDGWQGTVVRELIMTCCCGGIPNGAIARWTAAGVLQISYDGGTTWEDFPEGDPRRTGPEFPPLPGDDGPEKACAMANNIVNNIRMGVDDLVTQLGTISVITEGVGILADFLGGFGLVSIIPGLIMSTLGVLFAEGADAIVAAMTDEAYQNFFCILLPNMPEDGNIDGSVYEDIYADILASGETANAIAVFGGFVFLLGPVGLENASRTGTGTGEDCDCSDTWCKTWDFTVNDGGFSPYVTGTFGATYHAGSGWGLETGKASMGIYIQLPEGATLTDITTIGTGSFGSDTAIHQSVSMSPFGGDDTGFPAAWIETGVTKTLIEDHFIGPFVNGITTAERITHFTLSGTGANPFGTDDC